MCTVDACWGGARPATRQQANTRVHRAGHTAPVLSALGTTLGLRAGITREPRSETSTAGGISGAERVDRRTIRIAFQIHIRDICIR